MTEELIAETPDDTPANRRHFDAAIRAAIRNQRPPEEVDRGGFDITVENSPPLRSKKPIRMSEEDEEDMDNLVAVHEVHDE